MKTTVARLAKRRKKLAQHRCVVTRNGMPTILEAVTVRCPQFRFTGRVCFPLPLPPGDPYVFRSLPRADRALERTERLCRKLRESIHLDWILGQFPALQPFALPATWAIEHHKPRRA